MRKFTIRVIDQNARRRIQRMPSDIRVEAVKVLDHYAQLMYQKAVQDTPVLTGNLQGQTSLERFGSDGASWRIVQNSPKAAWTEFGTGQRGAATNQEPLPEGYAHGSRMGQKAQPHLIPAVRLYQAPMLQGIKEAAKRGSKK